MSSLLAPLRSYYNSVGLNSSVGPLYGSEAPAGAIPPFVIVSEVGTTPSYTFATGYYEWRMLALKVYATKETDADTLGETVRAALNFAPITVTAPDKLGVFHCDGGLGIIRDPGVDRNGNYSWYRHLSFRVFLTKARP